MHSLAVVFIRHEGRYASTRSLVARDAALWAQLDTLLFRHEQPQGQFWGVQFGFAFDWCKVGGRWHGWGREVRALLRARGRRPCPVSIPRFLERNTACAGDVARVRLTDSVLPSAVLTPDGEWEQSHGWLQGIAPTTVRERKAKAAWRRKVHKLAQRHADGLAVAVDYHW